MNVNNLIKLGLNRNEAKIYLALLELGESQAGYISKKSGVNRTTTYDSIERLIGKGLVSFVVSSNKKIFQAVKPGVLTEQIKEKEKIAAEIVPELELMYKGSKEKEESVVYKSRKGIKSVLLDVLKCREYVSFGSSGRFLEIMKHDFLLFQKKKKELKIKSRVILSESSRGSESVKKAYSRFRFIADEFSSPTTTFVYGKKVAVIIWGQIPVATVITSRDVAKSYGNYFELLWRQGKK